MRLGTHRGSGRKELFKATLQLEGFPVGTSGKEYSGQCRRHERRGFNPWIGTTPWKRAWKPIPVILAWRSPWTEESGGLPSTG